MNKRRKRKAEAEKLRGLGPLPTYHVLDLGAIAKADFRVPLVMGKGGRAYVRPVKDENEQAR